MLAAAWRDCAAEMVHLVNRYREREEEQEVDISSVTSASPVRKVQGVVLNPGNALRHRNIPKCYIPKFLIMTFLSVMDTYVRTTHVPSENRSHIQSLALMRSAIIITVSMFILVMAT